MAFGQYIRLWTILCAFFTVAAALPAVASPLDLETCNKLKAEKQSLTGMGVEKNMAKGPEWAKTNLKPAQLDQVKRYITVDEQIKFRCRSAIADARAEARAERMRAKAEKKGKAVAAKPEAKAKDDKAGNAGQPEAKATTKANEAGTAEAKDRAKKPGAKPNAAGDTPDDTEQD